MKTQDINNSDREFEKVAEMLTPKFVRKNEFSFTRPQNRFKKIMWTVGGVAAMLVIVLTLAIKSITPVSAAEVINDALVRLSNAKSVKADFALRGVKTTDDEIYTPDPAGDMIYGTLYILVKDDKIYNRVDWHDDEKNSIIYNGTEYLHINGGKIVNRHPSQFSHEIFSITNLKSIEGMKDNLIKDADITTGDNIITVKLRGKDILTYTGEFNRNNKQLIKASVMAAGQDGKEKVMLETKSITTDIAIPENVFFE